MKLNFFRKICLGVLPLFLLTGCCRILLQKDPTPYRVVNRIRIVYQSESMEVSRDFYHEDNIRHILDYLRYVDPYGVPKEDPELFKNRIFYITLIYTDGSEHVYEQRDDRFLRIDNGKWMRIESQKALYLSGLLAMMTSDEPLADTQPLPPLARPYL